MFKKLKFKISNKIFLKLSPVAHSDPSHVTLQFEALAGHFKTVFDVQPFLQFKTQSFPVNFIFFFAEK